jgi:ADP-ribose pyrophosphatase YjhB (NUDIX family)
MRLGGICVIEAVSCGGVVIHKGKILLLYKNHNGKYVGWVLPKGTLESGENYKQTALREVKEEASVTAKIIKYVGKIQYNFQGAEDFIHKTVHWYLMGSNNFYFKPQEEEHFVDGGYYKFHEAYHLLKFHDERQIMKKAYYEYMDLKRSKDWNNRVYK